MTLAADFGSLLRAVRGPGSRRALARGMDVAPATLAELEDGRANPTLARVEEVAEAYGLELRLVAVEPELVEVHNGAGPIGHLRNDHPGGPR